MIGRRHASRINLPDDSDVGRTDDPPAPRIPESKGRRNSRRPWCRGGDYQKASFQAGIDFM
jgi:hypothetical protein